MTQTKRQSDYVSNPDAVVAKLRNERGFSLTELIIVLCIALVMMSFALLSMSTGTQDAHIREGFDATVSQMRIARSRAIAERKQYIVCLGAAAPLGAATPLGAPTAQSIQLFRWDAGTAIAAAVQVSAETLPTDIQFQTLAGIPTGGAVPDGFGAGIVALDFDQAVTGGNKQQIMFMPDGSARDINMNLNSGIVYLAKNGQLYSSRAVTLFGGSGRIRGWQLVKLAGINTWVQQ